MKFLHLADLHIGKRVNEFLMLQDQEYVLQQILAYVAEEKPQAGQQRGYCRLKKALPAI